MTNEESLKVQQGAWKHGSETFKEAMMKASGNPPDQKTAFAWTLSAGYDKWIETGQGTAEEIPPGLITTMMQNFGQLHAWLVQSVLAGDLAPVWEKLKHHAAQYPDGFIDHLTDMGAPKHGLDFASSKLDFDHYMVPVDYTELEKKFATDPKTFKEMYECEPLPAGQQPMPSPHFSGKEIGLAEFLKTCMPPDAEATHSLSSKAMENIVAAYGIPGDKLGNWSPVGKELAKLQADAAMLAKAGAKSAAYEIAYGGPAKGAAGLGVNEGKVWAPSSDGVGGVWVDKPAGEDLKFHPMGEAVCPKDGCEDSGPHHHDFPAEFKTHQIGGEDHYACSKDGCDGTSPHGHSPGTAAPLTMKHLDKAIADIKKYGTGPNSVSMSFAYGLKPTAMIHDEILFESKPGPGSGPELLPSIKTHTHLLDGTRQRCVDQSCPVGA